MFGFCFTHNNYTPAQELAYRGAVGQCGVKYIIFGREVGANGTPHLQGYLQINHNKYDRIKKKFGDGIHLEPQRGTFQQATDYCKKDGDFFEAGEPDTTMDGKTKGQRSDLMDVKKAIDEGKTYEELCESHFTQVAMYSRFIKEQVQARDACSVRNLLRSEYENSSLRPWQQRVVDIVMEDPNPRKIHWIWEETGDVGKSWMSKYLVAMHNACILSIGKKQDMAYVYSKNPSNIVVFDLSRTTAPGEGREHCLDGAYSLAEDLKNGLVMAYKYDSTTVIRKTCHVIFFANFPPDLTKWSADRYFITHL